MNGVNEKWGGKNKLKNKYKKGEGRKKRISTIYYKDQAQEEYMRFKNEIRIFMFNKYFFLLHVDTNFASNKKNIPKLLNRYVCNLVFKVKTCRFFCLCDVKSPILFFTYQIFERMKINLYNFRYSSHKKVIDISS